MCHRFHATVEPQSHTFSVFRCSRGWGGGALPSSPHSFTHSNCPSISSVCPRRGLNPPHRVKSISMTTFSQQEVEFLQNHGNEVSGLGLLLGSWRHFS